MSGKKNRAGRSSRTLSVGRPFPWGVVLKKLGDYYEVGNWRIPYLQRGFRDPFQVLISTILSQRTRDEATHAAAERLFEKFPTPQTLVRAPLGTLERLIHDVGFHRTKAKALKEVSKAILDRYDGKVPSKLEELVTLPMVGRKTANCVIVFGFDLPAIPVDTHVHRISQRLGVASTRTPEETEEVLVGQIPRGLWRAVNSLLVQHGQNVCRPIGPKCPICPIRKYCATGSAISPSS
jgi:endonuclease-3